MFFTFHLAGKRVDLYKNIIMRFKELIFVLVVGLLLIKRYMKGGQCRSKVRLTGKTALVTGANTGIGKETVRDFAERGKILVLNSNRYQ